MAEDPADASVDACITDVQSALDRLKAAQAKDDDSDEFHGKNLKEAGDEAYIRVRAHNRRRRQENGTTTGRPDGDDGLK